MTDKPSIVEVIGQRIDLRRRGKEHIGLCPFHGEKTPSFSVSDSKQFFHCFGCHEHGDVIAFIMKIDGLSFSDTCKALGIDNASKRQPPTLTTSRQRAAVLAAAWVNETRAKFNVLIADVMEQRDLADEVGDFELAEIFDRELTMLRGFYDSLNYPIGAAQMLALRPAIEAHTDGAAMTL